MVEYDILEESDDGPCYLIQAGKAWTDENNHKRLESFRLFVPKEQRLITYAVLSIELDDDRIKLWLHAHSDNRENEKANIDAGGDIEQELTVATDLFSKWTNMSVRDIESALRFYSVGDTYNLFATMPRIIKVGKESVEITLGTGKTVDAHNVCNNILNSSHPLDR